mmetsp:Transcript_9442/g.18446  ORF Transcript_9442/g.18446 Transcript_9442/m.18446 type:complete len:101 (-) Transcript_9442:3984-4286(-)
MCATLLLLCTRCMQQERAHAMYDVSMRVNKPSTRSSACVYVRHDMIPQKALELKREKTIATPREKAMRSRDTPARTTPPPPSSGGGTQGTCLHVHAHVAD